MGQLIHRHHRWQNTSSLTDPSACYDSGVRSHGGRTWLSAYLGITDNNWFDYLRRNQITDEVNFWVPSARSHMRVQPGALWLFKLHSPLDFIAGVGVFMHYSILPLQLAWDAFGTGNGAPTMDALHNAIRAKVAQGHTGRMTAGFCWPWSRELDDHGSLVRDLDIDDYGYSRLWNARPETARLPAGVPSSNLWAYDLSGIDQVGCVYTAQGFEFDYVGVIFGRDLVYRFAQQDWTAQPDFCFDSVVKRSKGKLLDLLKNTYRVLLTRGLKGCYVFFQDKETADYVRSRME